MRRFVILLLIFALCLAEFVENSVNFRLESNWNDPPFLLKLVETAAGANGDIYVQAITKALRISPQEDLEEEEEVDEYSDRQAYEAVRGLLSADDKALFELLLANKVYSPRIIAHYNYFNSTVWPEFKKKVQSCTSTFGPSSGDAWVDYNGEVLCNPQDIFALKTSSNTAQEPLEFDRVIGSKGPLVVLYGDVADPSYREFFQNLYHASSDGKLRFVARYTPGSSGSDKKEVLSGYGIDLKLKRTDYIVIDDRDIKNNVKNLDGKGNEQVVQSAQEAAVTGLSFLNKTYQKINGLRPKQIKNLDFKLANYILNTHQGNGQEKLELLTEILGKFPKYAHDISRSKAFKYVRNSPAFEKLYLAYKRNQEFGIEEQAMQGLYVNGKRLDDSENQKQNFIDLLKLIQKETSYVKVLRDTLGIDANTAKNFISEYSRLSAIQITSALKRYDLRNETGIVYFNDLEKDTRYSEFSSDRQVWKQQQFPQYKENVIDLVFAVGLSDLGRLAEIQKIAQMVIQRNAPHRVGVLPIVKPEEAYAGTTVSINGKDKVLSGKEAQELDQLLADDMYHVASSGAVDWLQYISSIQKEYFGKVIERSRKPARNELTTVSKFSIFEDYVIVNGVFEPFLLEVPTWRQFVGERFQDDVKLIAQTIGSIDEDSKVADILYQDALTERNLVFMPDSDTDILYKYLTPTFLESLKKYKNTLAFNNQIGDERQSRIYTHYSFMVAGNYGSHIVQRQLIEMFNNEIQSLKAGDKTYLIKYRLIDTGKGAVIRELQKILAKKTTLLSRLYEAVRVLEDCLDQPESLGRDHVTELLSSVGITEDAIFMINSRVIALGEKDIIRSRDFSSLVKYESRGRLFNLIFKFAHATLEAGVSSKLDLYDWTEVLFTVLTATYHGDDHRSRVQLEILQSDGISFSMNESNDTLANIVAVINPIEEESQRVVYWLGALKDLKLASIKVLFTPKVNLKEVPVKRFYQGLHIPQVEFDSRGVLDEADYQLSITGVPETTLFTLDTDFPYSWVVLAKTSKYDLDNIKLDLTEEKHIEGVYELTNIVVEGYSTVKNSPIVPIGCQLELWENKQVYADTNVMAILGYFQLKAEPGIWNLKIKSGSRSSKIYSLQDYVISVLDLSGPVIRPVFTKNPGQEDVLINDEEEPESKGLFSSWFKTEEKKQADINIFAVASGHLYERLLSIMTASVRNHTEHTVKFWLIDNYMSANFKEFLPTLAAHYKFEYELINYKWPYWLRDQREKQRTIWGYKILFLDVLFPQSLDKVIFVDADQIIRTDLQELNDVDLQGAPYGYTPMCDSRKEMEGFRFWKQGYWKQLLDRGNMKYHISALYVVDLKKFRSMTAGDLLRQHYQQLSQDPNSLSNLDQDLPNNLQYKLKIHSLDQDWLWCETWCDDQSLSSAKTIDLCNNPLTKEPKLDRARRQIPEWSYYDNEIGKLLQESTKTDDSAEPVQPEHQDEAQNEEAQNEEDQDEEAHDEL